MAEPLKKTTSLGDTEPRTARARSERDIGGRSKRPARGERSSSKPSRQASQAKASSEPREAKPRPETRTEARPRNGGSGSRPTRGRSGSPQRPRDVKAGSGARVLAPIALVIFAIACFAVVSNSGDSGSAKSSEEAAATKAAAASAAKAAGPTRSTYRVKAGDSFAAIAEKQGVDVQTLQELNPDIDPRALQPGQKLKLK
jgi:LysM repeat protein